MSEVRIERADAIEFMRTLPDNSVDLVFGSPPYEQARLYLENGQDMKIARSTEEWVSWMALVYREAARVCKGLVAFVVEGQTRNYRYSCGPLLLAADLHRAGFNLRKPPIFRRIGIPGSGGPDWLRNDYEFIICVTGKGKLPWSDNTACGHPPKWAPGGEMSHRLSDGARVNEWGGSGKATFRNKDGTMRDDASMGKRPSHRVVNGRDQWGGTPHDSSGEGRKVNGEHKGIRERSGTRHKQMHQPDGSKEDQQYDPPVLANPGNVICQTYTAEDVADLLGETNDIIDCKVGGGLMGDHRAHENEAPFPESLADFFVKSFCPPDGIVLDCFLGSGTTLASAVKHGRRGIGCDVRQSQVDLAKRRIAETQPLLF